MQPISIIQSTIPPAHLVPLILSWLIDEQNIGIPWNSHGSERINSPWHKRDATWIFSSTYFNQFCNSAFIANLPCTGMANKADDCDTNTPRSMASDIVHAVDDIPACCTSSIGLLDSLVAPAAYFFSIIKYQFCWMHIHHFSLEGGTVSWNNDYLECPLLRVQMGRDFIYGVWSCGLACNSKDLMKQNKTTLKHLDNGIHRWPSGYTP
jgi:hypothetical protein